MATSDIAFVVLYDEETQQFTASTVAKSRIESAMGKAIRLDVAPEQKDEPITDEHARLLGGMAFLVLASGYPELRSRLQVTTKEPMKWDSVRPKLP